MDEVEKFKEHLRIERSKKWILIKAFISLVIFFIVYGIYTSLGNPGTALLRPIMSFLTYEYVDFLFFTLLLSPIWIPLLVIIWAVACTVPRDVIRYFKRKHRQKQIRKAKRDMGI